MRNAFVKLAEQGLLTILPQRGTFVSKIAFRSVLDARFLRAAIEADIVKLLSECPDPALIDDLRDQIGRQRAVGGRSTQQFMELDERCHRTLAEGAGQRGAWRQIVVLKSQMDRVRFLALKRFPVDRPVGQHGTVVDMIAARSLGDAETAIRLHLREILNDLPEILRENPEFFELPEGDVPEPVNAPIPGG